MTIRRRPPELGRAALLAAALALAPGAHAEVPAVAAEPPATGTWQPREHVFTYMGFTSLYSCDGLADKLKRLLLAAGARADARVTASGCETGPGTVARFPRATLRFHALVPGEPAPPAAAAPPPGPPARQLGRDAPKLRKDPPPPARGVGAWQPVALRVREPRELAAGDCELVEQFRAQVLPLLSVRGIVDDTSCVPHQLTGSRIDLRFETFAGLPDADAPRR